MKNFKVKKVVNNLNELAKVDKKQTIKNIRKTKLGCEYSCEKLHALSDLELIKVCKLCKVKVINKKPSKTNKK